MKVTPEYLDTKIYELLQAAAGGGGDSMDAMRYTQAAQNVVICKHHLQEIENRNKSESELYSVEKHEHS